MLLPQSPPPAPRDASSRNTQQPAVVTVLQGWTAVYGPVPGQVLEVHLEPEDEVAPGRVLAAIEAAA